MSIHPLTEIVAQSVAQPRFNALLMGIFALLALVLAAVGLHGVISYSVVQRTREIGIRMALGAERGEVLKLVLRQGMSLIVIGLSLGLVGALALSHFLASLVYGVQPTNPVTFIGVSVVLFMVGLLASYIPACRAANVDPMVALRYE
jgi:putative ABC transport system permease protein